MIDPNARESNTKMLAGWQVGSTFFPHVLIPCHEVIQIVFAVRENRFRWLALRQLVQGIADTAMQ
jgi:hypothetical protein